VPHDGLAGAQLANKVFFIGGGTYSPNTLNDEVEIFTDNGAAIDEHFSDHSFAVSPNPTSGPITIRSSNTDSFDLFVYDSMGRLLDSHYSMQSNCNLDLSRLKGNIFFLRIVRGRKTETKIVSVMK
jgi:hypothetical protein